MFQVSHGMRRCGICRKNLDSTCLIGDLSDVRATPLAVPGHEHVQSKMLQIFLILKLKKNIVLSSMAAGLKGADHLTLAIC